MIRVLLIEDDPMVQEVNRQFVMRIDGFQVVGAAGNGVEGLRKIHELSPDLVILDIYMPEQNGIETLQQIRRQETRIDVIVVTAANDHPTVRNALQNGAVDYIIKPFTFERMQKALEKYKLFHHGIRVEEAVSQRQLDEFFHSNANKKAPSVTELPKGLNEVTYQQIISHLQEQKKAKSAEEVADAVGIARVTARRYLDYLVQTGDIKIELKYGGVGRPVNRYIKTSD